MILTLFSVISCLLFITLSQNHLNSVASNKTTYNINEVSSCKVALVLGCNNRLPDGRTNLFFKYRIEAAAKLFQSAKIEYLIVSGANPTFSYDEPTLMKNALIEKGVPSAKIICDFAGLRTLDSIVRAKTVWGINELIVVSQEFHNKRAITIGNKWGINVHGYNATNVALRHSIRTRLREKLAVSKAILDLYVLHTEPRFKGPKESFFQNTDQLSGV